MGGMPAVCATMVAMETQSTPDQARTLAVLNQKGGVGKSTTVAQLGHGMARLGAKVLVIDLSVANHSLSGNHFGMAPTRGMTLGELLADDPDPGSAQSVVQAAPEAWQPRNDVPVDRGGAILPGGHLDVIIGGPPLLAFERSTAVAAEMLVKMTLEGVAAPYDAVLIDLDGKQGKVTTAALFASGWQLTPTQPAAESIAASVTQFKTINRFTQGWNHPLRHAGFLCTMFDARKSATHGDQLARLRHQLATFHSPNPQATGRFVLPELPGVTFGGLLPQLIPARAAVERAADEHLPVADMSGGGMDVANAYTQVALLLLHLTSPAAAAAAVSQLQAEPVEGVWPLTTTTTEEGE